MRQAQKKALKSVLPVCLVPLALVLLISQAGAQDKYPSKPIDIIVGYGAGGANDVITRVVADYMKKKWGVPVNVINKPGGNSIPATLELYGAAPDGYTLMGDATSSTTALEYSGINLPFNLMDRTYVGQVGEIAFGILVPAASPIKTLKDLELEAKRDPEHFTWASQGGAGSSDLLTKMFIRAIGVDVVKTKPVMSQSGAQGAALIIGGHVKMGGSGMPSALPLIKGGQVRVLAVTSRERWPFCPEVPTAVEQGYPSVVCLQWNGITGPPKLNPNAVQVWGRALEEMVKDPAAIAKLKNLGTFSVFRDGKALREMVMKASEEWGKALGLK